VPKWDKCINVLGEYVKKLWHLSGISELHLRFNDFPFNFYNTGNLTYRTTVVCLK
jgi:hypothetical protein